MKRALVLCVFVMLIIGLSRASVTERHDRGCRYVLGKCYEECPVGTHSYSTGCGYLTPEATCEEPNPVEEKRGRICDFSSCYCDPPTVRNKESKKCVPLEECPKHEQSTSENKSNE